jgi:hypothetical protein
VNTDPSLPKSDQDPDDRIPPAPWSFRIMVALAVLYLVWRLIQGIVWVIERIA